MNSVPNRKQQRRQFLRAKGKAYGKVALVIVAALAFVLLHPIWHNGTDIGGISVSPRTLDVILTTLILSRLVVAYKKKLAAARQIPYVAPVTPSTLTSEEVLVRGAEQPSTARETLLRPAIDDSQTPAEQLLRATNRAGSEQA